MENHRAIGEDAFQKMETAVSKGINWIAVNTLPFYIDEENIELFSRKIDALTFAMLSKHDGADYKVFYAASAADIFRNLPYQDFVNITIKPSYSSTINTTFMEQKAMEFNENQFKRSGFAEAFTPELQQQMKEGVASIQHPFHKEYDGDKVDVTLHLKKSATSDYYFLNKFDLQLQKEGREDLNRQTFYVNYNKDSIPSHDDKEKIRHENRYTLKEAYNLLAGRPVHKHLLNREGQEYQAWVKINFDNKLDNGNYEMKQYTQKYGFDLGNVLSKYPIKELGNDQYKQALIDSLSRGNLQKATFVGSDSREEKLFVSPNITLGALNVYDLNKQRITVENLVSKELIGAEFSKEVLGRLRQKQFGPDEQAKGQSQNAAGQAQEMQGEQTKQSAKNKETQAPSVGEWAKDPSEKVTQKNGKTIKAGEENKVTPKKSRKNKIA